MGCTEDGHPNPSIFGYLWINEDSFYVLTVHFQATIWRGVLKYYSERYLGYWPSMVETLDAHGLDHCSTTMIPKHMGPKWSAGF